MTDNDDHQDVADLQPEDKMGFAVPKTPTHSLMLLNSYMRTDMLQHIHLRLHKMRAEDGPGSPLHHRGRNKICVKSYAKAERSVNSRPGLA